MDARLKLALDAVPQGVRYADIRLVEWEKEAWKDINTRLYDFYKTELYEFKSEGTFTKKTLSNSNDAIATVTANSNANNGLQTLTVGKLAKGSYLNSSTFGNDIGGDPIKSTTLAGDIIDFSSYPAGVKLYIGSEGGTTEVDIAETDTLQDIADKLKS